MASDHYPYIVIYRRPALAGAQKIPLTIREGPPGFEIHNGRAVFFSPYADDRCATQPFGVCKALNEALRRRYRGKDLQFSVVWGDDVPGPPRQNDGNDGNDELRIVRKISPVSDEAALATDASSDQHFKRISYLTEELAAALDEIATNSRLDNYPWNVGVAIDVGHSDTGSFNKSTTITSRISLIEAVTLLQSRSDRAIDVFCNEICKIEAGISSASLSNDGTSIWLVAGIFVRYPCGDDGYVHMIAGRSFSWNNEIGFAEWDWVGDQYWSDLFV